MEARLRVRLEVMLSLASVMPLVLLKVRLTCVTFGPVVFTVLFGKLPSEEGDSDTWKMLTRYVVGYYVVG